MTAADVAASRHLLPLRPVDRVVVATRPIGWTPVTSDRVLIRENVASGHRAKGRACGRHGSRLRAIGSYRAVLLHISASLPRVKRRQRLSVGDSMKDVADNVGSASATGNVVGDT